MLTEKEKQAAEQADFRNEKDEGKACAGRGHTQPKERRRTFREQLKDAEKPQTPDSDEVKRRDESASISACGEGIKEEALSDEWVQAYRQAADRLIPRMLERKTLFYCQPSGDVQDMSCIALAAALAEDGLRMLLVQADILRKPDAPICSLYDRVGVNGKDICQTMHEGLDILVLPSARESLRAYTHLHSLLDSLEIWEQRYDGILVLLPAPDAFADMPSFLTGRDVLFAVRKGKTRCQAFKRAVQRVREAGAAWTGALFLTEKSG